MKRYRFHPEARLEYILAIDWYRERSESTPLRFTEEVEAAVASARESPRRYRAYGYGASRVIVEGFPYSVVFRDTPDEIQVIAVAHAKRRPGYWRTRSFR